MASASQDTVNVLPSGDAEPGAAPAVDAFPGTPKNEWNLGFGTNWIGSAAHAGSVSVPGWAFATAASRENETDPKFASGRTRHAVPHSEGA